MTQSVQPEPTVPKPPLGDIDRDSVHILPLSIIPFETKGLERTRMIKNAKLESVIELFADDKAGSGQVAVGSIRQVFADIETKDIKVLSELAKCYSYDVYCLRIQLRKLGIPIENAAGLQLSEGKQAELQRYMSSFTQRVIMEVYGDGDDSVRNYADVVKLFRHPDKRHAAAKLRMISDKLGIALEDVPMFLEDFGDIYLSVAYYRDCWESVQPAFSDFAHSVQDITAHHTLKQDRTLMTTCNTLFDKFIDLNSGAAQRFRVFEQNADKMWANIDGDRFGHFKGAVMGSHKAIGGILCKLSVKMDAWMDKFPEANAGGALKRAEFIRLVMQQGI